jgi:hypothetical protein
VTTRGGETAQKKAVQAETKTALRDVKEHNDYVKLAEFEGNMLQKRAS